MWLAAIFVLFEHPSIADQEYARRIQIAADRIGSQCIIYNDRPRFLPPHKCAERTKHFLEETKADFLLCIDPQYEPSYIPSSTPCFIHLTYSSDRYLREFPDLSRTLKKYAGVLYAFPDPTILHGHRKLPWYPTCYATDFRPPENFDLFYVSRNWDPRRTSDKIYLLLQKLHEQGYLQIFGLKKDWLRGKERTLPLLDAFQGPIPVDGVSTLEALHRVGVALLFHSDSHFKGGVPTSRIFEAVAAGAIVITDRNPFIVDNFGDSVLYINETEEADQLFKQIDTHMQWIRSHQEEAIALARRAHAIFLEKFTLEQQLQNLIPFIKINL